MITTHSAQTPANTVPPRTPHQVNERVQVQHHGQRRSGRVSSIHHNDDGVEYVIRLDASDGGIGSVVNIWTTSGQSSFLTPLGGEQR